MSSDYVLITALSFTVLAIAALLAGHLTMMREPPRRFPAFLLGLRTRAVLVPLVYRQQEHRHRINGFPVRRSHARP